MFEVFCCPSTTTKHTPICVKRRDAVAHRGAGVSRLDYCSATLAGLPSSETTHASVCAERRCTADRQSLSSGPHSAVTAQITQTSDARTRFVLAGSAGVSLPPRLCTWLSGFRSLARVTPQRTSTTALFDYLNNQRWSLHALCVLPLATAPFQRLLHRSGTVCLSQSGHRRRCKFSAAD